MLQFQSKVQQTLTTELSVYIFSLLPFPFLLYKKMKRSFMLFPLVALFIAVWCFISRFHLRFCRLFLGEAFEMCFWLQTILFPFSLNCSSRLLSHDNKKKKTLDFQSELSYPLKPKSIQYCPKEGRCCSWLTWKKNRGPSLSLALLASLVEYGWTSNDWLGVICVTAEATWVLFYVPCWRLYMKWVHVWESWYVSVPATRWWSYSWYKKRD